MNPMNILEQLRRTKMSNDARLDQLRRERTGLLEEKQKAEEQLFKVYLAKQEAENEQKELRYKMQKLSDEEEKWRDQKTGLQDELKQELDNLAEVETEIETMRKEGPKKVIAVAEGIKDICLFYDEERCKAETPRLMAQLRSQEKELEELIKQAEAKEARLKQLKLKEERLRTRKDPYPSDETKHFMLKEARKYRLVLAKESMKLEMELRRLDAEGADMASEMGESSVPDDNATDGAESVADSQLDMEYYPQ